MSGEVDREKGVRVCGRHRHSFGSLHSWYLLPLALLFALSFPALFGGDWEADDSIWAAFGLAALRGGPWWQPSMFDQPYFHKPPLGLWIHGVSQWVFGPTVFAARLPSLVAAGVAVVATGAMARRWCGRRAALYCSLVLATTVEFFRQTQHVSLDLWMAAWFALAAWCVSSAVARERARYVLLAGVFLGFALLTKQMIALFALPMFAAWLCALRRWRLALMLIPAGLVAVAIAAPWYFAMDAEHGATFWREHIGRQSVERIGGEEDRWRQPWWFYAKVLAQTYWPWLLTLVVACVAWARGRFSRRDSRLLLLAAVWCGAWVALLSLSGGKAARYMLFAYPMLAVFSGLWLARLAPIAWRRAVERWLAPVVGVACVVAVALPLLGVRVHEPMDPTWPAAAQFIREHEGETVWSGNLHRTHRARLYLLSGRAPRTVIDQFGAVIADPPAGELVMYVDRREPAPPEGAPRVFESGRVVVIREPE